MTAKLFVLKNSTGNVLKLTNYGARIMSFFFADSEGTPRPVIFGFEQIEDYFRAKHRYLGATIGRFANRIARGEFYIDQTRYHVTPNDGQNALHGGKYGFHEQLWDTVLETEQKIIFNYLSKDGEEGFPGNLSVKVTYEFTSEDEIMITYDATADQDTVLNLTNHAYFNLTGDVTKDVLSHQLLINAAHYLPLTATAIPTGTIEKVKDTPFDFSVMKAIGHDISVPNEQLKLAGGYDHCYVLNSSVATAKEPAAIVYSPESGITLKAFTTQPGLQFYSANAMKAEDYGFEGQHATPHLSFCLEAQHFPDSPNQPPFPSTLIKAGEHFQSTTRYQFTLNTHSS